MGKLFLCLLLLIFAVGGAGFANYKRNAHLDNELQNRPYAGLADEEVGMLLQAYREEKAELERQLQLVAGRQDPMKSYAPSDLAGKLKGFDRAQRNTTRWKEVQRQVLEREVEIERLEHEKSIRDRGLNDEWTRIRRRILTF